MSGNTIKKPRKAHHPYQTKDTLVRRLNRLEGQIRGIARMISEDLYCDDILHQFASVEAALHGVRRALLEAHLKSCVVEQIQAGRLEVLDELLITIKKINR